MRYPLTTEYYRLLFSGELGFSPVATFTSYPSVLGIELNDDGAEEAFSVYDHPKVILFKKTPEYSRERVGALLGAVDLTRAIPLRPVQLPRNDLLCDVKMLYETSDPAEARALLRKYGVASIVVGGLERAYYPPEGLAKFETLVGDGLDVAYRDGGVTIYRTVGLETVHHPAGEAGQWRLTNRQSG